MTAYTNRSNSDRMRQWANLIAIVAAFGINIYSNLFPPNGRTIGEISNILFKNVLIIPANYAFAIWGLIYLGLISFAIYQFLPAQRQDPYLRRIGYFLVMASLAQIVWVFVFEYELFARSLLAMLAILLPLIGIYLELGIAKRRVSRTQKWLVQVPLSIYLGWISVATIVNVAIALYSLGWNGGGISPQIWTAIVMVVAGAIAATIKVTRDDFAFPLVIVWALVAIAVRQANQLAIALIAGILALALGLLVLVGVLKRSSIRTNND
ncbi:tryptophan-rich sensory protein [Planktothrix sp. FACHB-1355]|uniref:Tryptophan-rich sensory protein n=1 Tax=Aerosakkonema funiforme FACHB-1375 TaxID=2949571 RepID=A0A926VGV6_9CYAN|nr:MULTISPECIES: TspO/MBR family protein [Oscillatoriales]MBD2183450.1 tryptophan-rich sensory protein [Aerosakkonema funiforme FACHB-1375]MBD3560726.1 tryptophan-rich sensory protein [Planktothrix sp. FACHB-1355]